VTTALAEVLDAFKAALQVAEDDGEVQFARPEPDDDVLNDSDLAVDLEVRKAGLRARLANFEREEAEWQALLAKVDDLDVSDPDGDQQQREGGGAAAAEAEEPHGEVTALRKLRKDVHRRLAIQVEGVCMLVGDVAELVDRANRSAKAVHADYHKEKFKTFEHVDSPAVLIGALTRRQPPKDVTEGL
jgi:hypothetical protein